MLQRQANPKMQRLHLRISRSKHLAGRSKSHVIIDFWQIDRPAFYKRKIKLLQKGLYDLSNEDWMKDGGSDYGLTLGIMFHVDGVDMNEWCQLRLELTHNKYVFDRYNKIDGDQFFAEERAIIYQEKSARVQIIVSGNIIVMYVDDVALCARCYDIQTGYAGVFVEYGTVNIEEFAVRYH